MDTITPEEMTQLDEDYQTGNSTLPDPLWDQLVCTSGYKEQLDTSDSSRPTRSLLTHCPSIPKVFSINSAIDIYNSMDKSKDIFVSFKYDGVATIMRFDLTDNYYHYSFTATRGDGINGKLVDETAFTRTNITQLAGLNPVAQIDFPKIESALGISVNKPEAIELRGELYSTDIYTNRSVTAGIMNGIFPDDTPGTPFDFKFTAENELSFLIYSVVIPLTDKTSLVIRDPDLIENSVRLGGKKVSCPERTRINDADDLERIIRHYTCAEDDRGYSINGKPITLELPLDGLVINTSHTIEGKELKSSHKDIVALKVMQGCYKTRVIEVFDDFANGKEIKSCRIEEVQTEDGRSISQISLHNPIWYNRVGKDWVSPGATIFITGGTIPIPINPKEING